MYKIFTDVIEFLVGWCTMDLLVLFSCIFIALMITGAIIINTHGKARLAKGYFPARTRRNFIFGLAFVFSAFSVIFILISFAEVGVAAFALPVVVLLAAFLTEAVFALLDCRKGIKICQCQCVSGNQKAEIKQGQTIDAINKKEGIIKQPKKEKINENKAEQSRLIEIKEAKAVKQLMPEGKEEVQPELIGNQKFGQERERLTGFAKQPEEQKPVIVSKPTKKSSRKVMSVKAETSNVKYKPQNTKAEPGKTKSRKAVTSVFETIDAEPVRTATVETRTVQAADEKPVQTVTVKQVAAADAVPVQAVTFKPVEIVQEKQVRKNKAEAAKNAELPIDQRMASLSQRLNAIRGASTAGTEKNKSTADASGKSAKDGASDLKADASNLKTGAKNTKVITEKRTGKYNEEEVQNALAGLLKSMNTVQRRNEDE